MGEEARLVPKEFLWKKRVYPKRVSRVPPKESLWENPIKGRKIVLTFMSYYVYILQSQSHQTYYYGHCADLEKRISAHNNGKVRYTKGRRPWVLHYFETFNTRSEAVRRERFFKSMEGYRYLKENNII